MNSQKKKIKELNNYLFFNFWRGMNGRKNNLKIKTNFRIFNYLFGLFEMFMDKLLLSRDNSRDMTTCLKCC